ncbi:putative dihydropyrimidinase, partial [Operophtera brumata]
MDESSTTMEWKTQMTIDATGKLVMPGGIDPHTHLELEMMGAKTADDFYKGTRAAVAGGTTTISPEGHQLSRDEEVEGEAVNRACVIANQSAVRALQVARSRQKQPIYGETLAATVGTDGKFSSVQLFQANAPLYIVHMMSKSAVRALQVARSRQKQPIYGETLAATVGTDGKFSSVQLFQANAPLYIVHIMSKSAVRALQALGKDNFCKIPNGVNGVEDRMAVLWQKAVNTGVMDPCRFVAVTSSNAAKIFNLWPQKGRIGVNSDADVVVWDPRLERTISAAAQKHAVDFNIFEYQTPLLETPTRATNGTPSDLMISKQMGDISVSGSGCSTPTGRKMREHGQRDLQTSTFSI